MICGTPSNAGNTFVFLNWLCNRASEQIKAWQEKPNRRNTPDQKGDVALSDLLRVVGAEEMTVGMELSTQE